MSTTQVKGHRIAEKSIELKHFKDDMKIPENRLNLTHPTHSNIGDLTEQQKNTLTQMGNADALHYHIGGGGGAQGIYTNEQRDIQLLKLNMMINSTKWGMDKTVRDTFEDDASVYYGVKAAVSPTIVNITDDPVIGGILPPSKTLTYGVVYKVAYGETDLVNTTSITTENGGFNAIRLTHTDVPPNNKGFKVFRTDEHVKRVLITNEKLSEWSNPYNLDVDLNGSDKTNGLSSFKVSTKGFINASGLPAHNSANIAHGVGKRILTTGKDFGELVNDNAPFEYHIQINNKATVARMDIVWDNNPAMIPTEYEVYYTTDHLPTDIQGVQWRLFERLDKVRNHHNIPLSVSTDGEIMSDCRIVNNSRAQNLFTFKAVSNITGIRIIVRSMISRCMLQDFRLFTEQNSTNLLVTRDFNGVQDLRDYSTLTVDIKSNALHKDNLKIGLGKHTEAVTATTSEFSHGLSTSAETATGRSYRQTVDTHNATLDRRTYDRIRIGFRPEPGEYIKIENIYVMLDTKTDSTSLTHTDVAIETTIVPVTFNNGLHYYEGTPTGEIISDWVHIDFPSSFRSYVISYRVVSGKLRYTGVTRTTSFMTTDPNAAGMEGSLKWNGFVNSITARSTWMFVSRINLGISNTQYMDLNHLPIQAVEKWHRHYIDLPSGDNVNDVRKFMLFFNDIRTDQDVLLDNVVVTRSKNIATEATVIGSNGSTGATNVNANTSASYVSDLPPTSASPKGIKFQYNDPRYVNKLIMLFGNKSYAGRSYSIQYTMDATASVNDAYGSPKWHPVTNLKVGEPGIHQEFTGTILNNVIYDNNVWANYIAHSFDPVDALKVRVLFFSTIDDWEVRIQNIKLMTADDTGEMKLIHDTNVTVYNGQTFTDEGKPQLQVLPPQFNTTGSHNVVFDGPLRIVRLIDRSKPGVLYLRPIDIGLYMHMIMSAQTTGDVDFFVSNDSGANFSPLTLDTIFSFSEQRHSLTIKAELNSADASLNAIAVLYSL